MTYSRRYSSNTSSRRRSSRMEPRTKAKRDGSNPAVSSLPISKSPFSLKSKTTSLPQPHCSAWRQISPPMEPAPPVTNTVLPRIMAMTGSMSSCTGSRPSSSSTLTSRICTPERLLASTSERVSNRLTFTFRLWQRVKMSLSSAESAFFTEMMTSWMLFRFTTSARSLRPPKTGRPAIQRFHRPSLSSTYPWVCGCPLCPEKAAWRGRRRHHPHPPAIRAGRPSWPAACGSETRSTTPAGKKDGCRWWQTARSCRRQDVHEEETRQDDDAEGFLHVGLLVGGLVGVSSRVQHG